MHASSLTSPPLLSARVRVLQIILLAFAIVAVSQCSKGYNTLCLVVNILTIVGCIFGIVGAFRLHAGQLNIFAIILVVLVVLEIIFIILAIVNDHSASSILWNFVVLALLVITLAFTVDLRNAVSGTFMLH